MAKIKSPPIDVTNQIPADTIILGFTGSLGSGSSFISEVIAKQYKFKRYVLSDVLKDIAKEKGIPATTENLQNVGNDLRKEFGNSVLVQRLLDKINALEVEKSDGIIIDSIRNDGEANVLKQFPYFYLLSIHADEEVRQKRTVGTSSNKQFKRKKDFETANKRDKAENYSYGQQVEKCNDVSDIIINNNKTFPQTQNTQKKEFIDNIYNKYISLIVKVKLFPYSSG